uniref:L1 transposable element RRM domain-containing protein n=1 Tax=Knipowitschia caucasica TaxID=637954 RepID=A0AAV2LVG7_KNICA
MRVAVTGNMPNTSKVNFFKGATATRLTTKRLASAPLPQPEEDASSGVSGEEGPEMSETMFDELRKMNATLQTMAADVITIKETTKELKESVESIQARMGEAEQRISDLEDSHEQASSKLEKCDKRVDVLWSRVEDLENRSRRNNVRIVSLKEGLEEQGKMAKYVEKILGDALGLTGGEFEIERAHCIPIPVPDTSKPPRAVLVRFLRSSAREKVLQVARETRGIHWEGCKLSIFEDFTRELAEKRKAFVPVKKHLRELQVKHRLVYPATLLFTWNGQKEALH